MSMIGKTLAHYEITSQLGKGGMGEVYQAKDRKLGRDVAIKVLPEEFAKDTDRVARFQREAKLLASLNHPNIAAIHGLEESGGINFLVLELVEGETLAEQLKRGPIPVEESLKLALQITEALEAAHEKGVIHRDLKPANIKVTPDGKVKVLDFGLAKAYAGEQAELNLSNSPTLSNAATQQGIILGTAAYMSPEQTRGENVDKKADIWAFGCVLFEMLAGRGMFEGRTVSDTLAAVLMREPDWKQLPHNLHPRIRSLLERCLEKEAKNRYSGIGDARVDIQKALADPSGVFGQPITLVEPRRRLRTILSWAAITPILIAIAGVAVWKLKPMPPPELRPVTRFSYELPKDQRFGNLVECAIAVSPDGRRFIYGTDAGLYLRSMNDMEAKLLPGTGGTPQHPFFSPDGQWVGFFSNADKRLKKIAISGGAPVTLADVSIIGSFNWNADDTIIYGQWGKGIMRVSANGGTPEQITKSAENGAIGHPQILPDGKSILFTRASPPPVKIVVQSLKSGECKELFEGRVGKYLSTGHIVYEMGGNLFAVAFDLNTLKTVGGPVPLVEGVLRAGGASQYAVSDSGTLVYVPGIGGIAEPNRTLVWVDRNGKEEPIEAPPNTYRGPRISPDGTRVALTVTISENTDIWIWDLVRKTLTRLTFNAAADAYPLWTRDGKRIAFFSAREGKVGIYWKAADGTGQEEFVGSMQNRVLLPSSWSADAKTLVLTQAASGFGSTDIGALSMEGDRKHSALLQENHSEADPQISPDGRWMAYTSNESGNNEIYVRPFPNLNGGRWQVSTSGGSMSLWSPSGRELFYRNGDSYIAVEVETEPAFKPGKPKVLFKGTYSSSYFVSIELTPWDIHPDGKRFLMIKPLETTASAEGGPRRINIVLNWLDELKQRVPVK
jgi:serine/threonine protein kinase/Tol biopolymer transport system component